MAEMADLRENNQRLQEESLTASEQLRKFNKFFPPPNSTGSDRGAHSLTPDADSKREWSTAAEEEEECDSGLREGKCERSYLSGGGGQLPHSASTGLP